MGKLGRSFGRLLTASARSNLALVVTEDRIKQADTVSAT
jgi:hypothetical protein